MSAVYIRLATLFWLKKARRADAERVQCGEPPKRHYFEMLQEVKAYYAPVKCEQDGSVYAYPQPEQLRRVQNARKERWAKLSKLMYQPVCAAYTGPKGTAAERAEWDRTHKGVAYKYLLHGDEWFAELLPGGNELKRRYSFQLRKVLYSPRVRSVFASVRMYAYICIYYCLVR